MGREHTDRDLLMKGIKIMAVAVPFLALSPYLLTLSFLNKETFMFYVFLFLGVIAGATAIYLCFKGLNTILRSIF